MAKKMILEAGRIVGVHGVRGEVRLQPWCDSARQLTAIHTFYWDERGNDSFEGRARAHKNIALLTVRGVETAQGAEALRGRTVYVRREDLPLPAGRYFICDLLGLSVVDDASGEEYGTLCDVSETGANNVYHVRTPKGEVLLPAVPEIVKKVDIDGGQVRITPIKGLFDDED